MEEITYCKGRVSVIQGDITKIDVEAVVNAANSGLMGGGGVDGAIHRVGGPSILEECREVRKTKYPDGLPPGEAVATGAGDLPAKHVIHTVGPVWHGGEEHEPQILQNAYMNSLKLAALLGVRSIAFPSISTGVYGYPREKAAVAASETIVQYLNVYQVPENIIFVFFSDDDMAIFLKSARFEP